MSVHHFEAVSLVCGGRSSATRKRKRTITLDRAMRQASKAGVTINGATINADGSVTLMFGDASKGVGKENNEWDTVQ